MGKPSAHNYHAYLLRLWRENESSSWRASLEDPHTGERICFASQEQLFAFLKEKMASSFTQDSYET